MRWRFSEAEVRRRWREWTWVCSPCADKLGIEGWRRVHQGPYADKCYVCGGEARYVVNPEKLDKMKGEG